MASPADSLWLQQSISLADPLPDDNGVSPPRTEQVHAAESTEPTEAPVATPAEARSCASAALTAPTVCPSPSQVPSDGHRTASVVDCASTPRAQVRGAHGGEMDLTKMVLDTSLFAASTQRPSSLRYSVRASIANAGGVSALEFDELRSRYSQAKRELLKVGDVQKDLDFARFELTKCKEELKLTQADYDRLRVDVQEANERLETERRARVDAEQRAAAETALQKKESDFLKSQIEDLRQQTARQIQAQAEEREEEYQRRIESMREEMTTLLADHEQLQQALSEVQSERDLAVSQQDDIKAQLDSARAELADDKQRAEALRTEIEKETARFTEALKATRRQVKEELDEQKSVYDERLSALTEAKAKLEKESEAEVRTVQETVRQLRDELSAARHRCASLEQDAQQARTESAREVSRLVEEHRIALSEKQLQLEAAMREARSSKVSIDEENCTLRRKAAQLAEELSTVSAVLAQRERERDGLQQKLSEIKEATTHKDMEHARLLAELEMHAGGLDEANERLARLQQQRDALEEDYESDLRAAKSRIQELERKVMTGDTEIAQLRRETIRTHDSGRSSLKDLRAENDTLRAERDQLRLDVADRQHLEEMLEEARARLREAQHDREGLQVELKAVAGRCGTLERRLDDALRRQISQSRTSPGQSHTTPSGEPPAPPVPQSKAVSRALRSVSCTNRLTTTPGGSQKRARTEDARVMAISGFDGKELIAALKQLPSVALAECQSNVPVPSNLTHLITNGQATVKLLTALVRGCWVLPSRYVMDSMAQGAWLPESEYGFQHEQLPLQKRHVAMTDGFKGLKFHSNADLLLREGGAIVVSDQDDADFVLCTSRELDAVPRGMSWEGFVELIYPVKITPECA